MIAAGIGPVRNIVFSQNPDHASLAWIFNCVARLGWPNRFAEFFSALHITLRRRLATVVAASRRTIYDAATLPIPTWYPPSLNDK